MARITAILGGYETPLFGNRNLSSLSYLCCFLCFVTEIGPNRSTFDFWDDVVKPAWHDIVGRKFTASSFTYLCSQFNLDFRDALRNDTLKIEMHRLKSEVVCPEADAPFVICCMMHFFRSAEGVECFLDALKSASELNAGVWTILLSIWKQHGRNQSLRCVCSKGENIIVTVSLFSFVPVTYCHV